MSNNLFDIIESSSTNTNIDTYTLLNSSITVTNNLGTIISSYTDNTNRYKYWLFGINDLSYNITTTKDINNLGFVIVGETNSYDTSYSLTPSFHKFNLVTSSKISFGNGNGAQVDRSYENEKTLHIIYGCDYGSEHDGGAGTARASNGKRYKIPNDSPYPVYEYTTNPDGSGSGGTRLYDHGLNGILYKYCYKPYTNPNRTDMQLSELYGESKQNLMNISLNSTIGSIGGISKGNIPLFNSNKNISIIKTKSVGTYRSGQNTYPTYDINTYNLKYNNNTISTTNANYFSNNSGIGTTILNSDINSTGIQGNKYNTLFINTFQDSFYDYYYYKRNSSNYGNTYYDFKIPSDSETSKKYTINNNIQPNNVNIPFTIDNNVLLPNMVFDVGNKNLVFYPSGIQRIDFTYNYNGIYNINYHNRRFEPVVIGDTYTHDLIETYSIKCVREPYFDENAEILKYNATPNFALIYYPFTIEPLNIPSNITKLIIDGGASYVPTINLPSVPVGYQLNIQNDSFKTITTNNVARYVTRQVNIVTTITAIGIVSFTTTRSNITFTYKSGSDGRYWSMDV